jgi:hypothetical protein
MSHHFDSPTAIEDGRLNLCDVYAFAGRPGFSVLVMTVNPDAGRSSPVSFHPDAIYEFAIDPRGGVDQQTGLRVRVAGSDSNSQSFEVRYAVERDLADAGAGLTIGGGAVEAASTLRVPGMPEGRVWAGPAADPFWADGAALFAFLQAAHEGHYQPQLFQQRNNIFDGRNVTAIVLEVSDQLLGLGRSSIWATITLNGHAPDRRVSRMGQPMLRPLFFNTPGPDTEELNAGDPVNDSQMYAERVTADATRLAMVAGDSAPMVRGHEVAKAFLPDVLGYTAGAPVHFRPGGDHGRALTDDAFGTALELVTGAAIAGSAPRTAPMPHFPYLAAAHSGELPALAELFGLRPPGAEPRQAAS